MVEPPNRTGMRGPLVWLIGANTVSQIGNMFTFMAIPWFVLTTTGSATQTGTAVAVGAVPVVLVGIFGGAVVDRFGFRATSIVADLASGVTTLLIPLLFVTVGLQFWQLLVLVFLGAVLDGPGNTARLALFPELVPASGLTLDRANAIYSTTRRVAGLLGPPLAGGLIAVIGPANLLWIDAATFAVSAGMVALRIPSIAVVRASETVRGVRGYLGEIDEGFRFLWREAVVFWLFVAFSLGSLIAEPVYSVVLPVYARDVLGSAAQLGLIYAALGAGSLLGNVLFAAIAGRVSRRLILLGGFTVRALALAVLLATPPWWVIAAAILVSAALFEPINPMWMSISQERVPTGLRGRVFGASSAVASSTLPVGVLVYGGLLGSIGLHPTIILFVLVNLTLPVILALLPGLRNLSAPVPRAG